MDWRSIAIATSLVAFIVVLPTIAAAGNPSEFDFGRDVYQVLRRACFECHGAEKQAGGFRLDDQTLLIESVTIVTGDSQASEFVRRIELPRGHDDVMPVIGDPLSGREIAAIRRWIDAGAQWPEAFEPPPHWAYVLPQKSPLPTVSDPQWPISPIDHFVLAKLDQRGMKPSPPAAPPTLLRRVYLDLIGLPPTPAEVIAFESDPSPAALSKIVDQLMSRPQFGERWARPWLDLARYADSHGFQRDNLIDIWAYRDWVIDALNADMPLDQFTIEQIAGDLLPGDLLPGATPSQRIATGFHRCAPTNVEAGSLPEETRIEQVLDRVNTTAAIWLGTTMECAQCHDHKYDPFTIKDYYRFFAYFNNTEIEAERTDPKQASSIAFKGPFMPLADPQRDGQRDEIQSRLKSLRQNRQSRVDELQQNLMQWSTAQSEALRQAPQAHLFDVEGFTSTGTTDSYKIRDDGAILIVGDDPPSNDVYTITTSIRSQEIRAIRLDALTDDSLPGKGPGRGDAQRPNFVLHELTVSIVDAGGEETPLVLGEATADFSQANWDVAGAVDGDPKTGWAISPQFGKPHWAIFRLRQPLDANSGVTLKITLDQHFGNGRTLGCFRLSAVSGDLSAETIPAKIAKLLKAGSESWTNSDHQELANYRASLDGEIKNLDKQIASTQRELTALAADTTLVMVELEKPRQSAIFTRGDYRTPGESIDAGTPESLHPIRDAKSFANDQRHESSASTNNRLTLARWLVDPANPLVGRVTVNRWWAEIFGSGIVRTTEDFGLKGDPPTHPELLDWLAVDFVENGWSMKRTLKTIILSSTYQQLSAMTPEQYAADDQNRLLGRGPRLRMDAEMIRDHALAVSGLISLKAFGPPIRPYQPLGIWSKVGGTNYEYETSPGGDRYRRGVYVVIKRGAPYPSFINFDASARLTCTTERSRSNTPLQALTLLNDPVYVEAIKAIALRAATDAKHQSLESAIEEAFRHVTARSPRGSESNTLVELFQDQHRAATASPKAANQLTTDVQLPHDVSPADFSAWYSVATVLMNLHETITKE